MIKNNIEYALNEEQLKKLSKTIFVIISDNYKNYIWNGNLEKIEYTEDPFSYKPIMQITITASTKQKNLEYSQIQIFLQVFTSFMRCYISFKSQKTGDLDGDGEYFKIKKLDEKDLTYKILNYIHSKMRVIFNKKVA